MAAITTVPRATTTPLPRAGLVLLAVAFGVLWLVTFEGGVLSHAVGQAGTFFHELFHDGRHLIGAPCH
jgi:hypothetical protein